MSKAVDRYTSLFNSLVLSLIRINGFVLEKKCGGNMSPNRVIFPNHASQRCSRSAAKAQPIVPDPDRARGSWPTPGPHSGPGAWTMPSVGLHRASAAVGIGDAITQHISSHRLPDIYRLVCFELFLDMILDPKESFMRYAIT